MTHDFIEDSEFESGANYPTIFGLTLAPPVQGILLGLVGLGTFGGIMMYLVSPTWESYQALDAKVQQKSQEVQQQESVRQQIKAAKEKLAQAIQQRDQVYTLFANEKSMDTLLLDLNQQVEKNNVGLLAAQQSKLSACPVYIREGYNKSGTESYKEKHGPIVAEARLNKFKPSDKETGVITDSSLGAAVNSKLKRQSIDVEIQGNFNQTQSIFRTIERLQPLLLVKNLEVKIGDAKKTSFYDIDPDGRVTFLSNCQPDTKITTSFQMQALMPLNADDRKLVAAAAAAPAKK